MSLSLVLGVNGQDGSYMAETLTADGSRVLGVDLQSDPGQYAPKADFDYRSLDISIPGALSSLLAETRPERIFHFSAIHGSSGFAYEPVWRRALDVNTASVYEILEYSRTRSFQPTLVYASSAKVFGDTLAGTITENSPKHMTCLYSVTKLAAEGVIRHYRKKHGARAGVMYFFNHESPRRPESFFTQILVRELHNCLRDPEHTFSVNALSFYCDWGAAEEYMELTKRLAEVAPGEDFIVATGKSWLGRDVVRALWSKFGLDADRHIRERFVATESPTYFEASVEKMRNCIGCGPSRDALDVCEEMARALPDVH